MQEEYSDFLDTVNKLPEKYYEIIRKGILQLNDDKKELLGIINHLCCTIQGVREYIDRCLNFEDVKLDLNAVLLTIDSMLNMDAKIGVENQLNEKD